MSLSFRWHDIEDDGPGWAELVRATGGGLFGLGSVLEAERLTGERRRGIRISRDGTEIAGLGGLVDRSGPPGRFRTASFPPMATVRDPRLPAGLAAWLRDEGVRAVELGSYSSGVEGYDALSSAARLVPRWEFLMDLTAPADELWSRLSTTHRRQARALEDSTTLEAVGGPPAGRLLAQARAHWAARAGHHEGLLARTRSARRARRLVRTLDGTGRLYVLRDSAGPPLAAAYLLQGPSDAYYMMGGSWPAGYERGGSIGLFWKLVLELGSQGLERLNLGGVPRAAMRDDHAEHGVYRFKRGFGAIRCERLGLEATL